MKKLIGGAAAVCLCASAGMAGTIVDGVLDGTYGSALSVQDTGTQFGDSNLGQVTYANGSELDAAYGYVSGGLLHLFLSGNLESNFNKLEIFFDSGSGGQNQLRGDNPDVDFNGLNRMGDDGSGNGLMFDNGFEADRYIGVTCGNTGSGFQLFANYAELLTGGGGMGAFVGGSAIDGTTIIGGALGIDVAIDNSNIGGVEGFGGAVGGAGAVMTGVELTIPLSALGDPTGDISVVAFINGGGHDFLSNQVLGPLGGLENLGEPRAVNFKSIDGNQYFVVPIPAPGAAGVMVLGALAASRRRRA